MLVRWKRTHGNSVNHENAPDGNMHMYFLIMKKPTLLVSKHIWKMYYDGEKDRRRLAGFAQRRGPNT
jgi:hypothetical protein